MFRNYNKRKVIVLCLGLAAMTMLPQWVSAQDNGGSGTQAWPGKSLLGRDGSGNVYSVSTSDGGSHAGSFVSLFGRETSGGGSGSGYNIFVEQARPTHFQKNVKNRKTTKNTSDTMKKLSTIIMALALVLGMSQCKKQETPTTGNTTPIYPGVDITVKVGDNEGKAENGEKHNIAPEYGLFAFSNDDVLYVGHNGQYVGSLTFNNGFFSGTIYPNQNVTDQPLHFYFVGNAAVTGTPVENETTSLSISIADQLFHNIEEQVRLGKVHP